LVDDGRTRWVAHSVVPDQLLLQNAQDVTEKCAPQYNIASQKNVLRVSILAVK
jgi:hypothetical protein